MRVRKLYGVHNPTRGNDWRDLVEPIDFADFTLDMRAYAALYTCRADARNHAKRLVPSPYLKIKRPKWTKGEGWTGKVEPDPTGEEPAPPIGNFCWRVRRAERDAIREPSLSVEIRQPDPYNRVWWSDDHMPGRYEIVMFLSGWADAIHLYEGPSEAKARDAVRKGQIRLRVIMELGAGFDWARTRIEKDKGRWFVQQGETPGMSHDYRTMGAGRTPELALRNVMDRKAVMVAPTPEAVNAGAP